MIQESISDKYEILQLLHETAATAVLLVKHKQIGHVRILKAVQRSHPDAKRILSEANLLSGIKSPNVPTIFDVGQTEDFFYLVEEFIEGQPLQEYLLEKEKISLEELVDILLPVCEIFCILHKNHKDPLIYRDIKPEHIIINENQIKLIDFGAVIKKSETKKALPYCTKAFAAPEQLNGLELDERTDVYGIGKVIEYLSEYLESQKVYRIQKIIRKATEPEANNRFSSVKDLMEELAVLKGNKSNEKEKEKDLNITIGVVGNKRGVGCTHIAMNLCTFMNNERRNIYYCSKNEDRPVVNLSRNLSQNNVKDGVLYHNNFWGLMEYGDAIEKISPPNGNYIYDYGHCEKKPYTDYVIYVITLCPWKDPVEIPTWIHEENVYIITNFTSMIASYKMSKQINKAVFVYPNSSRIFKISKQEKKIFDAIRKNIRIWES